MVACSGVSNLSLLCSLHSLVHNFVSIHPSLSPWSFWSKLMYHFCWPTGHRKVPSTFCFKLTTTPSCLLVYAMNVLQFLRGNVQSLAEKSQIKTQPIWAGKRPYLWSVNTTCPRSTPRFFPIIYEVLKPCPHSH